jgi:CRISPR-associated protein Csd2
MRLDQSTLDRMAEVSDASKRYDYVFFVDIHDGNPNGDPDYDNRPRLDEETGQGLISDVCIKRKIRDYIDVVHRDESRNAIYVLNRYGFLEDVNANLVKECEAAKEFLKRYQDPFQRDAKGKVKAIKSEVLADFACNKWFDWRCFGAVPGKPIDRSTVRGPVQILFGTSIDAIDYREHAIGRVVQNKPSKSKGGKGVDETTEERANENGEQQEREVHGTFGAKYTVRYGAYRFSGHYSAFLAKRTGFNDDDLRLFWEALICWPCTDSSAARPYMSVQGLYVFRHEDSFGNAPAHILLDLVKLPPLGNSDARSWDDYKGRLCLPGEGEVLPGVTFHRLLG